MTENEILSQGNAQATPAEKMIPQSEVNHLAGKIREEAYQKGMAEAQSRSQSNGLTLEQLREEARREAVKAAQEEHKRVQEQYLEHQRRSMAQDKLGKFDSYLSSTIQKYPEAESKLKDFPLSEMAGVIGSMVDANIDNPEEVLMDLLEHSSKALQIENAAASGKYGLAKRAMKELSDSIKMNQRAINAREPLSQMKPSSAPTDKGPMTVADFRRAKWAQR